MSVGIYSLKAETNASSTGGSRGLNRMRRLPAIQLDSWEFRKHAREGSVMPNALVASDVDGDGVEEIVVGTTEGQILVVKPDHRMPIFSRTLAATISIVLYSATYRRLVLVTLEGTCEVTEGFLSGGCKVPPSASSNALQSKGQCDWGLPPSLEPSNHMNHSWGGHDEGKKSKTPIHFFTCLLYRPKLHVRRYYGRSGWHDDISWRPQLYICVLHQNRRGVSWISLAANTRNLHEVFYCAVCYRRSFAHHQLSSIPL
ncbi:hypothetical protein TCDM_01009 [Trypanosoma cruzi Dm28c]|uniref:FG-GAP repeat protein n=1 Tax=Trypanosoma cruzi Dm28c TaxID=1416333 RepID=V5C093_TRYCR|nr:hypothetical protein TCDM_01009 [Trypanosoma cruzi Dm28c]